MRLLRFCAAYEIYDMLYWHIVTPDGFWAGLGNLEGRLAVSANCSDLFWWATADGEEITKETIGEFEQAVLDCIKANDEFGYVYGPCLYACRCRKMRPQGAAYPKEQSLWPLFDACGPKREIDIGNPKPHASEAKP
jgi:hypothetical protein